MIDINIYFFPVPCGPTPVMASSRLGFLDHTQRRTIVGRTSLDEWSARQRDLYLTTHNTQHRQTSLPPTAFEPTITRCERPQTYSLDRAGTGTGTHARTHTHADIYTHTYISFSRWLCIGAWGLEWSAWGLLKMVWILTLTLLMWRICWALNNGSTWQMEFNSAFKGLNC